MDIPVEPIAPGYDAEIAILYPNDFADAVGLGSGDLVAEVRADVDSAVVLFTARTSDNTITIDRGADETEVTMLLPASATAGMTPDTSVAFDFMRIAMGVRDPVPGLWRWPVRRRVTRDVS